MLAGDGLRAWAALCLRPNLGAIMGVGLAAGALSLHEIEAAVMLQPMGIGRAQFVEARKRSVERARAAAGKGEIAPIMATEAGEEKTLEKDDLAGEKPLSPGDEAYAANLADGAAAVIVGSAETAKSLGRATAPRVVAWARATVEAHHAPKAPVAALAQLFKTTPQFWMHMQANFDLKAAMARRRALKLAGRS